MDISVRSPHGDADISVALGSATTVGEIVVAVTGQAAPRLVRVDDRLVPSATPVDASGARNGSLLSVEIGDPVAAMTTPAPVVRLVQVAGPGTGRVVGLEPGRYRLGPGRRLHDDELKRAPVEAVAAELDVGDDGVVRVTALAEDVRIDAERVTDTVVLGDRMVSTGTRAFLVERCDPAAGDGRTGPVDTEAVGGTVLVQRSPRRAVATRTARSRPVVDAIEIAAHRSPALWERRPDDDDAGSVAVGLALTGGDGWRPVEVSLRRRTDEAAPGGTAIVGAESFRLGLARALLADLAVAHAPADVRIVVATTRPGIWEWAKWLPHVRTELGPAILAGADAPGLVIDGARDRPDRRTVLVADDPAMWTRRDGALRGVWSTLPATTMVVALCSARSDVPAICATTVSEERSGRVTVSGRRSATEHDVLPAVAEQATVERLARLLAPLVDADDDGHRVAHGSIAEPAAWSSLCGLPADVRADTITARWAQRTPIDTADTIVVRAGSVRTALDVASGLILDLASRRPPEALQVLAITGRDTVVGRLPHSDPPITLDTSSDRRSLREIGVDRLARRVRALLADPDGPDHIALLVEADTTAAGSVDDLVAAVAALGGEGVTAVVATDARRRDLHADRSVTVVEHDDELRLVFADATGEHVRTLRRPAATALDVRPFLVGRRPTPAERRIEQQRRRRPDPDLERLARVIADAAPAPTRRPLAPPPPPTSVDLAELLERHPGDAIPLGLLDRPDLDDETVWWWQPSSGSMLAVGGGSRTSPRPHPVAEALLVGIATRLGDDDLDLVTLAASPRLRDAAAGLPHSALAVVHGDLDDDVVGRIRAIVATPERPVVVLIDDLALLRATASSVEVDELLRGLLATATVVATASSIDGLDAIVSRFPQRLVGGGDEPVDPELAAGLGVAELPRTGLGILLDADTVVHLATVDDLEPALSNAGDEPR